MSYRYKNVSESEQVIVGVGVVQPGQEFITSVQIINPNFEAQSDVAVGTAAPVSEPAPSQEGQK